MTVISVVLIVRNPFREPLGPESPPWFVCPRVGVESRVQSAARGGYGVIGRVNNCPPGRAVSILQNAFGQLFRLLHMQF